MTASPASGTLTLTDFLLARIGEDEAAAKAAHESLAAHNLLSFPLDGPLVCESQGAHVALDPARVLAQCAALRAVVELHARRTVSVKEYDLSLDYCVVCGDRGYPCATLRALAAIWVSHPEFREEWT